MAPLCMVLVMASVGVLLMMGTATSATPLDDYVNTPDSHYTYTHLKTFKGPNVTLHILNMTSQKWLDEQFSNRPVWWHYLTIIVPDNLKQTDSSLVLIDDGKNTDDLPTIQDRGVSKLIRVAVTSGTVVSDLKQVPNQPTIFKHALSQKAKIEDDIVAFTWRAFLENGSNPEVLLRLPMTKAVVRAMDTVTDYCQKTLDKNISRFVVTGFSKRGWATWTTAAVDKRVIGFAPGVMDLLNMHKNLHHSYRLLGGWSFPFFNYYIDEVTMKLDTDNFGRMAAVIDPIVYNDRYASKPKCVISATGDEFFPPDGSHYYYDELKGPKYLRMVPNEDHRLKTHLDMVFASVTAFYMEVIVGAQLPSFRWQLNQTATGGEITLWTDREPTNVTMIYAQTLSSERRDFRLYTLDILRLKLDEQDIKWQSKKVQRLSSTQFQASMDKPAAGWAAFYIEATFLGKAGGNLTFTTSLNFIPDTFPFEDCHGMGCFGTLK